MLSLSKTLRLSAVLSLIATAATAQTPYRATPAEIRYLVRKLDMATSFFETAWSEMSRTLGTNYSAPFIQPFEGSIQTPCGERKTAAAYCPANHTIYFEQNWLAGEMRRVGSVVGTDGDVGAIVVIAHEWGHAMHHLWRLNVDGVYQASEAVADCFAGAVLRESARVGHLERGDLEEAQEGLRHAGDDRGRLERGVIPVGHPSENDHGPGWLRVDRYQLGFRNGVPGCLTMLRAMQS